MEKKKFLHKVYVLQRLSQESKAPFNILTTMLKATDEVQMHSRFITWLLDPWAGIHGLKDKPLELFLKQIDSKFKDKYSEYRNSTTVKPNANDWKEEGEIDILIENEKQKFAIIIENKIYAKDSNHENRGQLDGYYKQIRDGKIYQSRNGEMKELHDRLQKYEPNEIEVYYLTCDGHNPSPESLGKNLTVNVNDENKKFVKKLEYKDVIIPWLDDILKEEMDSYTHEMICQYKDVVQSIVPNVELNRKLFELAQNNKESIKEIVSVDTNNLNVFLENKGYTKEEISAAYFLHNNIRHILWHIIYARFETNNIDNLPQKISELVHQKRPNELQQNLPNIDWDKPLDAVCKLL